MSMGAPPPIYSRKMAWSCRVKDDTDLIYAIYYGVSGITHSGVDTFINPLIALVKSK